MWTFERPRRTPARYVLVGTMLPLCAAMGVLHAQDARVVDFDAAFLAGDDGARLDLSRFSRGNPVLPGTYDVDVWMNGEWQVRKPVRFAAHAGGADATPCMALDELVSFGVAADAAGTADDLPCLPIAKRIDAATARFDVGEQRLDIEVPQAAMTRRPRGVVAPEQWERGTTAGLIAWRTNLRRTTSGGSRASSFFGVDVGLNRDAWRLRHAGAWSGPIYRRRHGFAERQLDAWHSRLRIGDIPSSDDLFTPVRVRGVSIVSDARMSADALVGYAPRVKGLAGSHAVVRVTQNGVLLREVSVPPGPFAFDDLYAAGRGGDIEVDVEESDGRHHRSRVPFFPVPELLREGQTAFALHAGHATLGGTGSAALVQTSWRHGFRGGLTLQAGWRHGSRLTSYVMGAAIDTRAGAFAIDLTQSASSAFGSGRLWRLRQARQWHDHMVISFGASQGQDDLALPTRGRAHGGSPSRRAVDVSVQKDMSGGALSVTAGRSWNGRRGGARDHAASWVRAWRSATLDVSLRHASRRGDGRADASAHIGFSVPLAAPLPLATAHASFHNEQGRGGSRFGLNGAVDADTATTYGAALTQETGETRRIDGSLSRVFTFGDVTAGIDHGASTSIMLSASGAAVMHAGGLTLAQRLGDAVALVRSPGAEGARVGGHAGVRLDRRGYAVVPHLVPFRWNSIDLDPTGLSLDVSLASTHRRVAPTHGAVVLVPFDAQVARTRLVTGRRADGANLPFGAEVVDREGRSVGVVGQSGRVFLRAAEDAGVWKVRWAEGSAGTCELRLDEGWTAAAGDRRHTGVCE